ncbi:hypothetical protein, partial [Azovibrio restrictus]|uniref:hypothetical protein n=1 Tax=Azovibrio restrictus TaxID=146938 RepID=UPI0026EA1C08
NHPTRIRHHPSTPKNPTNPLIKLDFLSRLSSNEGRILQQWNKVSTPIAKFMEKLSVCRCRRFSNPPGSRGRNRHARDES